MENETHPLTPKDLLRNLHNHTARRTRSPRNNNRILLRRRRNLLNTIVSSQPRKAQRAKEMAAVQPGNRLHNLQTLDLMHGVLGPPLAGDDEAPHGELTGGAGLDDLGQREGGHGRADFYGRHVEAFGVGRGVDPGALGGVVGEHERLEDGLGGGWGGEVDGREFEGGRVAYCGGGACRLGVEDPLACGRHYGD